MKFLPIDREITVDDHTVEVRTWENGGEWGISHSIACRPNLLDCPYHHYMRDDLVPPAPGRYFIVEDDNECLI